MQYSRFMMLTGMGNPTYKFPRQWQCIIFKSSATKLVYIPRRRKEEREGKNSRLSG